MNLLRRYLKMELPTLMENNIRLQYIGRQQELPQEVQERMAWAREMTARNTGMVLTLALNYGSRTELVDCFNALVNEASRTAASNISRSTSAPSRAISTPTACPNSIWSSAPAARCASAISCCGRSPTAEIYVTETLWPDFRGTNLLEAIEAFQKRERRFGGLIGDNGNFS